MFTLRFTLLTLLFVPVAALAHQINGTIQESNGQPVQNKDIEIHCPSPVNANEKKTTDNWGSFSFFIPNVGRCTISVDGATYTVYSSQNPVRYDLILDSGRLRRR
jgi:hypothetical protein